MNKIYLTLYLIVFLHIQLSVGSGVELLYKTIESLNMKLRLELNVFVNVPHTEYVELLSNSVTIPILILSESNSSAQIYGLFTEKLLTVVFFTPNYRLLLVNSVVKLLWRLHFTDLLLVYNSNAKQTDLLDTFEQCWQHGFLNVLAVVGETLFTYHPFPGVTLAPLRNIDAYYNKTHLHNFQRYILRSSITNNSPRTYKYHDRDGKTVYAGYLYRLVLTFIEHYNGTFEELRMRGYAINLTETIEAFQSKRIDILAALLYMYPNYSHSISLCNYRTYILVPHAQPIRQRWYLLKPLSFLLWIFIVICFVYCASTMSFIHWLEVGVFDFSSSVLRITKAILFLPGTFNRKVRRVHTFFVMLPLAGGFLLTNVYQTSLASILITRLYEPQLNSIADISRTHLLIPQTEMDIAYLHKQKGVPQIVYDRLLPSTPEEVHNWRRDLNATSMHTAIEDKITFFMYQQKFLKVPFLKRIDEHLFQTPVFLTVPHGSPFLQLLNRYLRRVYDTGIFQKFIGDSAEEGILSGEIKFYKTKFIAYRPLSPDHFLLLLVAWCCGILIATICFLFEIGRFKFRNVMMKVIRWNEL